MDSDDICFSDRIEKQVEFLEQNEDISICGTDAILFGNKNGKKTLYLKNNEQIRAQLLYKATLIHPTVMVRRCVFEEFKYNEKFIYSQDFELWSRASEKYKIAVLSIKGIKYRMHNKQISIDKEKEQAELSKEIIKNNSMKINGEYDEKICNTLYVLGLREKFKNYNKHELKKVLYNRFFELMLSNKMFPNNIYALKECLKLYNFRQIMEKLKNE